MHVEKTEHSNAVSGGGPAILQAVAGPEGLPILCGLFILSRLWIVRRAALQSQLFLPAIIRGKVLPDSFSLSILKLQLSQIRLSY